MHVNCNLSCFFCHNLLKWSPPPLIHRCHMGSDLCCERLQSHIMCSKPFQICRVRYQECLQIWNWLYWIATFFICNNFPVKVLRWNYCQESRSYNINIHLRTCILSVNTTMQFLSVAFTRKYTDSRIKRFTPPSDMIFCYNLIYRTPVANVAFPMHPH